MFIYNDIRTIDKIEELKTWMIESKPAEKILKDINNDLSKPTNKGWVCPICGRGVSPIVTHCECTI